MFSRLKRWLDRLVPFDFQVEHKPGAKIGLADYLSRHSSNEAAPISMYDKMFTVAKNNSIRNDLGFFQDSTSRVYQLRKKTSKGWYVNVNNQRSIYRFGITPVEGV